MNRGYFENHRYIKFGVYDIVFWTKKPKKIKNEIVKYKDESTISGYGD
jgi:hypothetical protein